MFWNLLTAPAENSSSYSAQTLCPGGRTNILQKLSLLFSLFMQNYTLQPVYVDWGKGNSNRGRRRLPSCKLIIFSQDPCSNRNNCWVSWNSGTPPSNSWFLASQQCLERHRWRLSQLPCELISWCHSPKSHTQLQPNTKLSHGYTGKHHEMFAPGWKGCRVTQIWSLHFLLLNKTFQHPIQNWNVFYRGWSSS